MTIEKIFVVESQCKITHDISSEREKHMSIKKYRKPKNQNNTLQIHRSLRREEVKIVLAKCDELLDSDILKDRKIGILGYVAIGTGLRRSEINELEWDDFIPEMNMLKCRRLKKRCYYEDVVYISDTLVEKINKYKAGFKVGFLGLCIMQVRTQGLWDLWKELLIRANVRHVRLHDARHTRACMIAESTGSAVAVRDALGHSNISTSDLYISRLPSAQLEVARKTEAYGLV